MWKTATLLVTVAVILAVLGIVMLGSASRSQARLQFDDQWYFVKRQILWLMIGILAAAGMMRVDYAAWRQGPVVAAVTLITIALLSLALVPGIGVSVKGSSRWLSLGIVRIQPSEFAKLTVCIFLAWWMARVQRRTDDLLAGLVVPVGCLGLIIGLIFYEPDFGTTLVIGVVGITIMFAAGARMGYLVLVSLPGLIAFCVAVMRDKERRERVLSFLYPEKYAEDQAYQLINAIYAFVVGGGMGTSLGKGLQKEYYLPEAHTDFIFAIIGEELGLGASLATVIFFLIIFICGLRISLKAPDDFGRFLGFGLTLMITLQAIINMGVVTGCLPTKGLALPFISFGGSSLVASLAMVGILVNISQHAVLGGRHEARAVKDCGHRL
ncbi:MAG: putative lipid II flippase FtsW [Kiritimatiellae bacterium]|nr:putative lipid II flippase FtsW [Kiritimatiellia bacterium]